MLPINMAKTLKKPVKRINSKTAVSESKLKNMTMDMLTKTRVFTELDIKLKMLIIAAALVPVGILTYIGMTASSIENSTGAFAGIDISSARSSFFYEASNPDNVVLPNSDVALINNAALAHGGSQSLKFSMKDKYHFSQSYFNYIGVNIGDNDVLEFYIRSATSTFDTKGLPNAIYTKLTYSVGDPNSTSDIIDLTPQFPDGLVTAAYQKIEIPREMITGNFSGKMRSLYIGIDPSLVGSGQAFLVDDITVRRRAVVLEASSTKAVVLNNAVSQRSTSSAMIAWPLVPQASGYKIYVAPDEKAILNPAQRQFIGEVNSTQTAFFLTGLKSNSGFYVRIEAEGTGKSYQMLFRTLPYYGK